MFGLRLFLGNIGLWLGGGLGAAIVFLCLPKRRNEMVHDVDPFRVVFDRPIPESVALAVFVPLGMLLGAFLLGYAIPKWLSEKPSLPPWARYVSREYENSRT
ncbi:MAG: hypothetical protein U0744_13800 [Gemmataceae bacterium]